MLGLSFIFIYCIIFFYIQIDTTFGCRCKHLSLKQKFENADVVVKAKIERKISFGKSIKYFLRIRHAFKGVSTGKRMQRMVVAVSSRSSAACGVDHLKKDETYLLSGNKIKQSGLKGKMRRSLVFSLSTCSSYFLIWNRSNLHRRVEAHQNCFSTLIKFLRNQHTCTCLKGQIFSNCVRCTESCKTNCNYRAHSTLCKKGCHCPYGTVYHYGECIPPNTCPLPGVIVPLRGNRRML